VSREIWQPCLEEGKTGKEKLEHLQTNRVTKLNVGGIAKFNSTSGKITK
jgi:hypothetical protein